MTQLIHLDGNSLTLEGVITLSLGSVPNVSLMNKPKKPLSHPVKSLMTLSGKNRVVYGVTTGFGSLCNVSISPEDTVQLQENLIRTHSSGFGDPLPEDAVRAIMLIRINSLLKGYSGIRLSTVENC